MSRGLTQRVVQAAENASMSARQVRFMKKMSLKKKFSKREGLLRSLSKTGVVEELEINDKGRVRLALI